MRVIICYIVMHDSVCERCTLLMQNAGDFSGEIRSGHKFRLSVYLNISANKNLSLRFFRNVLKVAPWREIFSKPSARFILEATTFQKA